MAEPQASRFWMAARQSGLLNIQSLNACWEAIPLEKRDAVEHLDRRLARQAVQQSFLTLWQAQQLLAGRTSGFRVDRYLLLELIGQGGMGRVYLARDTRLNRQVALKILAPERMNNSRAVKRFEREARVGAQLQHENLVRLYDFGQANGRYYLVMEYIEGKTIGALIAAQGPISPPTAARLSWQIALGLEHAHRKGLIHRDVNPYNILVTHEGIAKLADLGLARNMAENEHVTREGATVGTFDYVAPEQARHSQSADIRSDIYSLGCTLYHMVTGQVPFPSPSLAEKLYAHQMLEPVPLDRLIPDTPTGFVEVVRRMMRKQPDERYATPLQVAQALEPFVEEYSRIRESVGNIPLILDTGPGSSLTDSLSRSKSWFSFPKPAQTQDSTTSRSAQQIPVVNWLRGLLSWRDHPWLWWLDAAAVVLAVLLVSFMLVSWLRKDSNDAKHHNFEASRRPVPISQPRRLPQPMNGGPGANSLVADSKGKPAPAITVLTEDGEEKAFEDLFKAMEAAIGAKGWVILHNSEPLSLPVSEKPITVAGEGWLKLRAAQGVKPVLKLELKPEKPFLMVGSSVHLILDGLTFQAKYLDPLPGNPGPSIPGPIILAGGPADVRYCAFTVANETKANHTCALIADGSNLTIENCLFEGFQTALKVHMIGGSTTLVKQTMIVPATGPVAEFAGWGVRLQFMGGSPRVSARRLILEHCTVAGSGLLQLAGFSPQSPLQVQAKGCAVKTDALVGWEKPATETSSSPQALQWKGKGNQLDLSGTAWVVSLEEGMTGPATAAVDRSGWFRIATEEEPVTGSIQFSSSAETRLESLSPGNYAIEKTVPGKVGANPEQVGPGATVRRHSDWQSSPASLTQGEAAR
jgi:serine/threonine protein kinase